MLEQDENIRVDHEAENGKEAIDILKKNHLDRCNFNGCTNACHEWNGSDREIKARWPEIKIIILTTFNDEQYAMETLKDGASGFLLKTADSKQLIRAVYSALNDGMPIHEDVTAKVIPSLMKREEKSEEIPIDLTERELAITKLVGEGKTNKEIAEELYLSIGTVKNHITTILQKLELRDRTQLAIFAVKNHLS